MFNTPRNPVVVLFLTAVLIVFLTPADARDLSLRDILNLEGFGTAEFDPTGRWLIYEQLRPYAQNTDFSFRSYAMGKTGHQLWRYDLSEAGEPELLPGVDPAPHSYLQGFSPTGQYLAIMQYNLGRLVVAAYDMRKQRLVSADATPAFSRSGEHNPVWVSEHELAFSALPDGQLPALTSVRAFAGQKLPSAWADAWRGLKVTADEVRTAPVDLSDRQEEGALVLMDARTGKTRVLAQGLYADLRVSPDGRYLAAMAVSKPRQIDPAKPVVEDPRRYRLQVFDLKTGSVRQLSPQLEFFPYTIAWAPGSDRLGAFGWREAETPASGRFHVIDIGSGQDAEFAHIGLDLVSERERGWLQRPERLLFLGERIVVYARHLQTDEDQQPRFTYRDTRPTGLARADWYALAADGSSQNLTASLQNVSSIPVHADRDEITIMADDGAYRIGTDGSPQRITPPLEGRFTLHQRGTFSTRESVIRPEFGSSAVFQVTTGKSERIVLIGLGQENPHNSIVVEAPSENAMPLAGSLAAGAVAFRAEIGHATKLLIGRQSDTPTDHEIASLNRHLNEVDLGQWRVVTYNTLGSGSRDTRTLIHTCVLLPPNFNPETPPPLIVEVYPNARPNCEKPGPQFPYPDPGSPYLWAAKGYAYSRITLPRDMIRTDDGPVAGMPALVDMGVDAIVRAGYADANRQSLIGFSQGGISALYVAAKTTRFKAVIARNGWADLFSHYFGPTGIFSYAYGQYFGDFSRYDTVAGNDFGIGESPFDAPMKYIRNSPVFLAPRIEAPVLLIHSDMDYFSITEFDQMYAALMRSGKDARYVRYWGEGHMPSSPANISDMWQRMTRFLEESGVAPDH